jgi:hypothetical protein
MCQTCGDVGCCNSSPSRQGQIVGAGEDWHLCYVDGVGFELDVPSGPSCPLPADVRGESLLKRVVLRRGENPSSFGGYRSTSGAGRNASLSNRAATPDHLGTWLGTRWRHERGEWSENCGSGGNSQTLRLLFSLVARTAHFWGQGVAASNPASPTASPQSKMFTPQRSQHVRV